MKKVCDKHGQAYEITLGCLYCLPKEDTTKIPAASFPTSHAPGPVGCMDFLLEDKDLDSHGFYTFNSVFPIRDLHIKTTKPVLIIGNIFCHGKLNFNQNLTIHGSLETKKSIQGNSSQGSCNLYASQFIKTEGMIAVGGSLSSELDISVSKDIVVADIASFNSFIRCGGNITCDNISSFRGIEVAGTLDVDLDIQAQGIIYCHKKIKGNILCGTLQELP